VGKEGEGKGGKERGGKREKEWKREVNPQTKILATALSASHNSQYTKPTYFRQNHVLLSVYSATFYKLFYSNWFIFDRERERNIMLHVNLRDTVYIH